MFVPISSSVVAGRYELIDEIGRGGMGVVWRARQANLGVECAIKFIHEAHAHDPDVRRRFVREARVAASTDLERRDSRCGVDTKMQTAFMGGIGAGASGSVERWKRFLFLTSRIWSHRVCRASFRREPFTVDWAW